MKAISISVFKERVLEFVRKNPGSTATEVGAKALGQGHRLRKAVNSLLELGSLKKCTKRRLWLPQDFPEDQLEYRPGPLSGYKGITWSSQRGRWKVELPGKFVGHAWTVKEALEMLENV